MAWNKKIIVLVGASGSGKTTVGNELTKHGIVKLVTTTTRPPREGEVEGIDYYFVDEDDFDPHQFLETTCYNGHQYGLSLKEIESALDQHEIVHLAMDKNGARAMKAAYPDQCLVIYFVVSEEEMIKRMKMRGDSREAIEERVAHRHETNEEAMPEEVDLVIDNNDLEETVQCILCFIEKKK